MTLQGTLTIWVVVNLLLALLLLLPPNLPQRLLLLLRRLPLPLPRPFLRLPLRQRLALFVSLLTLLLLLGLKQPPSSGPRSLPPSGKKSLVVKTTCFPAWNSTRATQSSAAA